MESISYNVTDLSADQRHVFEGVLGHPLQDHQRIVVQLDDSSASRTNNQQPIAPHGKIPDLPDWVTIFADLSDEELAELDALILDRSESRPQELL